MRPSDDVTVKLAGHPDPTAMERKIYHDYIRAVDTAENFRSWYSEIIPALVLAGRKVEKEPKPGNGAIGFYLPAPSIMAHAQNLATYLRGNAKLDNPARVFVYTMGDIEEQKFSDFERLFPMAKSVIAERDIDCWEGIRDLVRTDEVTHFVHVSSPVGMAYAAAARIAPRHVWWSMKYHGPQFPGVAGHVTTTHPFQSELDTDGIKWKCTPVALPNLYDPTRAAEAGILRNGDQAVIFGCFGREQKLTAEFARLVVRILTECPEAKFVFSGRKRPQQFIDVLRLGEVDARCAFVGWVDTKTYAHMIDIYLDSVPFASGHTAWEAMAAGKPVVVMVTRESLESSTAGSVVPLLRGEVGTAEQQKHAWDCFKLSLYASTDDEYVATAVALVRNLEARKESGAGCRRFVNRYFGDDVAFARATNEAING